MDNPVKFNKHVKVLIKKSTPKTLIKKYTNIKNRYRYYKKNKIFNGTEVYCPCCNKTFSEFEEFKIDDKYSNSDLYPAGLSRVLCPFCGSLPRHRILCDYLEKNKSRLFVRDPNILIFSPAYALSLWFRRNRLKFISSDLTDTSADVNMDIQNITYEDEKFDFISCDHVLEHVPDYKLAITEMHRVIKKGGVMELTVPLLPDHEHTYEDESLTSYYDRVNAFGQFDHLRIFGADLETIINNSGFDVRICDGDRCDKRIAPLTAPSITDYNKIFICKKI